MPNPLMPSRPRQRLIDQEQDDVQDPPKPTPKWAQAPAPQEDSEPEDHGFSLPEWADQGDLVPDPHKRPGHWLHTPSGNVIACPPGWQPYGRKPTKIKTREGEIDMTGGDEAEKLKVAKATSQTAQGEDVPATEIKEPMDTKPSTDANEPVKKAEPEAGAKPETGNTPKPDAKTEAK